MLVVRCMKYEHLFISIIIAAFNARDTIRKTINSLLFQKLEDYEIIMKDGGSCDDTLAQIPKSEKTEYMFVNMRDLQKSVSSYYFPSKLFEYMMLGKPVLFCRLEGIPEEYFKYFVEMKSLEPKDIAAAIRRCEAMMPQERVGLGCRQYMFVTENKNNIAQAQRIVAFEESIL